MNPPWLATCEKLLLGTFVYKYYRSPKKLRKRWAPLTLAIISINWGGVIFLWSLFWQLPPESFLNSLRFTSQREVNATFSAVGRSDGLKWEGATCPGFWPESSVICISQWPGGRHSARDRWMGDSGHPSYKHHREELDRFLSDCVRLKETNFLLLFYLWILSLLFTSWRQNMNEFWNYEEPGNLNSLPMYFFVLILRFLKGEESHWFLTKLENPFNFCNQSTKIMQQAKNVNTDHSRWKTNGPR